jgi:hypothetical protein
VVGWSGISCTLSIALKISAMTLVTVVHNGSQHMKARKMGEKRIPKSIAPMLVATTDICTILTTVVIVFRQFTKTTTPGMIAWRLYFIINSSGDVWRISWLLFIRLVRFWAATAVLSLSAFVSSVSPPTESQRRQLHTRCWSRAIRRIRQHAESIGVVDRADASDGNDDMVGSRGFILVPLAMSRCSRPSSPGLFATLAIRMERNL